MASPITLPEATTQSPIADEQKSAEYLLRNLPSLPTVSARLLGMMGRSDVNLKEISSLIVSDAVLTGEILRLSNSDFASRVKHGRIRQS